VTNLPMTTLPSDSTEGVNCPPWCTHADACRLGSYQGTYRRVVATAMMPTEFDVEPELDTIDTFVQQEPTDPAPFVYIDGHRLRAHEVRTLIRQLTEHLEAIEGAAR
jgi:hypothetical protein